MFDVGLVLSGGGTRGFAHIGAIKALEEAGIKADVVSGTSAGSIVGAMYSDGFSSEKMLDLFSRFTVRRLSRFAFSRKGLLSFSPLQKKINKYLEAKSFEELKIPLYVCISNLSKGEAAYVNSGPMDIIIRASSNIPVLYAPVEIGGDYFSDGAIFDNFPVKPIRGQCKLIIGINIMPRSPSAKLGGLKSTAMRIFQLFINAADEFSFKQCDVLIEPVGLADFGYLSHKQGITMFNLGYETAKKVLNDIGKR